MEVCQAIEEGIKCFDSEIETILHPLADGGDGSISVLANHLALEKVTIQTKNPLGQPIEAHYYKNKTAAFIELAIASGITLLQPEELNPLSTSTLGTGVLVHHAIQNGSKEIFLFLGGSATNDAGMGIAHALGYRFLDKKGDTLSPIGANLIHVDRIDGSHLITGIEQIQFTLLCDVNNPLFGKNGAAYVYAPQKGATPDIVTELDQGLRSFSAVIERQYGEKIAHLQGGGAAGGIPAGMAALFNINIKSGIQAIMELTGFQDHLLKADIIISGEGKLDQQTLEGKVIQPIAHLAKENATPLWLIVGQNSLPDTIDNPLQVQKIDSIIAHVDNLQEAMTNGQKILKNISFQMIKNFMEG